MKASALSVILLGGSLLGAPALGAAPAPLPQASPSGAGQAVVDLGRAVVMPAEISPPMASAVAGRFRGAVETGLLMASVLAVSSSDADQQRLSTIGECRTSECLARLASALKAAYVLSLAVNRVGKNYKLSLALLDPKGAVSFDRASSCDICTLTEAVTKVQALAQESGAELRRRVALLPRPEPPRRKVIPPRPEPPRRKVRPTPPPPRPRERPPAPRIVPPKPRPKPRPKPSVKQAAWMSASMGLASFVGGVTLLGLDGRYTCQQKPARLMCPYRYDTGTAGAVFTALGGASMVAAGVLFYYAYFRRTGRTEEPRATVGVAPTRGGAFAHAKVRF